MKKTPPKAPAPRRRAKRSAAAPHALPAALAKRSKAAHAARMQRLAERAQAIVARIQERQADIAANMIDIGLALVELKEDGMAEALGRGSFAEVCSLDLKMSVTTVNLLISVATRVPRELATRIGTRGAAALLVLADATPEDDSPADLLDAKLALPSGDTLDVAKATNAELREAAKVIRAAKPGATTRRSRGFSASPEEKSAFAAFVGRVKKHKGAPAVRASLVATRDKKGAKVRIEVRFAELAALASALAAATKKG